MVIGTLSISHLPVRPSPSPNPNFIPLCTSQSRARHILCPCIRGKNDTSWGSNAEDVRRPGKSRFRDEDKRRWWSDEDYDVEDDGYDDDDDFFGEQEQLWDKIWIFKVFKAYGYLLPAIIASMLLSTGPKAFLMALALPLGQSAFTFAFEKLMGRERPKSRSKAKKKPNVRPSNDFSWEEKEQTRDNEVREEYQSWAAAGGVRADSSRPRAGHFGGWDDLDMNRDFRKNSTEREAAKSQPIKRGKLSRQTKRKDTPFFLRLLIAVFPFLGSWTKLL